jgi:chemotaxis protein histidine kinase CheA
MPVNETEPDESTCITTSQNAVKQVRVAQDTVKHALEAVNIAADQAQEAQEQAEACEEEVFEEAADIAENKNYEEVHVKAQHVQELARTIRDAANRSQNAADEAEIHRLSARTAIQSARDAETAATVALELFLQDFEDEQDETADFEAKGKLEQYTSDVKAAYAAVQTAAQAVAVAAQSAGDRAERAVSIADGVEEVVVEVKQAVDQLKSTLALAEDVNTAAPGALNHEGKLGTPCPGCQNAFQKKSLLKPWCDALLCTACNIHFCAFCGEELTIKEYKQKSRNSAHGPHYGSRPLAWGRTNSATTLGWCLRRDGCRPAVRKRKRAPSKHEGEPPIRRSLRPGKGTNSKYDDN